MSAASATFSRARAETSRAATSSSTVKPGETPASSGKRRSSFSQKAWMVVILMPPGVSRARANRARALGRPRPLSSSASNLARSGASSITAQEPSSLNSLRCISAAAALV